MGASMHEQAGAGEPPVEQMSYTEASAELDAIVGFFEGRDVDVDQLVGRLVRATAIIEELDKRLRRTRVQVEQLVPRLTAVLEETAEGEPASAHQGEGDDDELAGPSKPASNAEVPVAGRSSRARDDDDLEVEDGDGAPGLF